MKRRSSARLKKLDLDKVEDNNGNNDDDDESKMKKKKKWKCSDDKKSGGQYRCEICDKVYPNELRLKFHKRRMHSTKKHECQYCERSFSSKYRRNRHQRNIHEKICQSCSEVFRSAEELKNHVQDVHDDGAAKGRRLIIIPILKRDNVKKRVTCDTCDKDNKSSLYEGRHKDFESKGAHQRTCVHQRNMSCPMCDMFFPTVLGVRKHVRNVHLLEKRRKCAEKFHNSVEEARSTKEVTAKVKAEEQEQRNFPCPICNIYFSSKPQVKNHVKTVHLVEKSHQCTICSERFLNNDILNVHMQKVHTSSDIKNDYEDVIKKSLLTCDICEKDFANKSSLRSHMTFNHNKCGECGRAFKTKGAAKTHCCTSSIHSAEGDFRCPMCNMCFSNKSLVEKHIRDVHNMEEENET